MAARQQTIYEVKIEALVRVDPFKYLEPTVTYFSNLKRAIDTLHIVLGAQGWPSSVSYSSVYRDLKLRDYFFYTFEVEGVKYFQLSIQKRIINPHLTTLGIDEMPRPRRK
ncbi:hypothetical protein GCM10027275_52320 [Rhabdobacter roseus]|uniref:Bisphosphoglycerate-dependent phosphoglycerate mutase n=1 Tax=Rhabdobacter roseus TaxID=1655419 RepID=A0A840U0M2_9BACT|nr:hypothetical protein [Rhabdobacter roseus]MBB5287307.1 bisphosphoglycerate-dependent phosphoglycerate mutase [Rhabdobacter roseus]